MRRLGNRLSPAARNTRRQALTGYCLLHAVFPCIVGSGDLTPGDEAWFANPPHPDWEGLLQRYTVGSAPDIDAMFADDVAESNAADGARRKE